MIQRAARFSRNAANPLARPRLLCASSRDCLRRELPRSVVDSHHGKLSKERLDLRHRVGAALSELLDERSDRVVELIVGVDLMHEADRHRVRHLEHHRVEIASRFACRANRRNEVGRDDRRQDAEASLAHGESCAFAGDDEIAGARESHAAAHAGTQYPRDGGLGTARHGMEHRGESACVFDVRALGASLWRFIHVQIGVEAENAFPRPEHDGPHLLIARCARECGGDLGDHRLVEGVVDFGTRHLDAQHALVAAFVGKARHVSRSARTRSRLGGGRRRWPVGRSACSRIFGLDDATHEGRDERAVGGVGSHWSTFAFHRASSMTSPCAEMRMLASVPMRRLKALCGSSKRNGTPVFSMRLFQRPMPPTESSTKSIAQDFIQRVEQGHAASGAPSFTPSTS